MIIYSGFTLDSYNHAIFYHTNKNKIVCNVPFCLFTPAKVVKTLLITVCEKFHFGECFQSCSMLSFKGAMSHALNLSAENLSLPVIL